MVEVFSYDDDTFLLQDVSVIFIIAAWSKKGKTLMAKLRALDFVLLVIAIIFGKIIVDKQIINCWTIFLITVCFILDSFGENVIFQSYKFFFHRCNSILKGNSECSFCNSILNLSPGKVLYFVAVSFLFRFRRLWINMIFFQTKIKIVGRTAFALIQGTFFEVKIKCKLFN